MARWTGTTTERGYGHTHRQERERRLALYRPGDTCAHGGEHMHWWPLAYARRFLDLPHTDDRSGYLPGLACRKHNRGDGARKRNRRARRVRLASRRW
jgi:hypothetical protein